MPTRDSFRADRPLLLSAMPPTAVHERLAVTVAVLLFGVLIGALPFRGRPWPELDSFIPVVDTLQFACDAITAALLYAQFSVARTRGLRMLAAGYLFTALIVVAHALTFPAAFSPSGLLGAGLQSTIWLYIIWHIALPPAAILYAIFKDVPSTARVAGRSAAAEITRSVVVVAIIAGASIWLVTRGHTVLPPIMIDALRASPAWHYFGAPPLVALTVAAIVVVWRGRTSVLDLWLLVVLCAWFTELILLGTAEARFSIVWYVGRAFGVLSSSVVLLVLLSESTMLYARLALSVAAGDRERDGRRMTIEAMIASIAHELRQPLGAIVTNGNAGVRLLARTPPDLREVRASLEDITRDARRADQVIESIRTIFMDGSQDAGWADVNQLIRDALEILRIELQTTGVTLQWEPASERLLIRGHRGQLLQLFLNLITNAIESMVSVTSRPRVLRIQTSTEGPGGIAVVVEDSGPGIDPANVEHIFEPFFTTKERGIGLGLAISRSIAEAHGGQILARSRDPNGSVFRVLLPTLPFGLVEQVTSSGRRAAAGS